MGTIKQNIDLGVENPTCAEFCEKTGRKKSVWYKYKKLIKT